MARNDLFHVGQVSCYLRGNVWYLRYHEDGERRQIRAGRDRAAVKSLAAQVNAQLETGAPVATSFEPITIPELRRRWLEHHEHVLRSSVGTINRYRTATEHLIRFVETDSPVKRASNFRPGARRVVRGLPARPRGGAERTPERQAHLRQLRRSFARKSLFSKARTSDSLES